MRDERIVGSSPTASALGVNTARTVTSDLITDEAFDDDAALIIMN